MLTSWGRHNPTAAPVTPPPGQPARSDDDAAPAIEAVTLWLEHVRWTYEDRRFTYDAIGRQAAATLAICGVLLALLAGQATRAQRHGAAFWVLAAAVSIDALSAGLCLWALKPRKITTADIEELRERWPESARLAAASTPRGLQDTAFFVESLLHGFPHNREHGPGPVAALVEAGRRRGWQVWAATFGVTIAAALVALYILLETW